MKFTTIEYLNSGTRVVSGSKILPG